MKILSLCDWISCWHIALERAWISVDEYYASEIKGIAIQVTQQNYPQTIQIWDLRKVSYKDWILYTEKWEFKTEIDLVMFGSPCQTFSIAMRTDKRIWMNDMEKSWLFLECYRILNEVKPKYFLMENVARMRDSDAQIITDMMWVKPIRINSKLVSPQLRDRYYRTNIEWVTQPKDKWIKLQDILTSWYTDREKARALLVSDSRPIKDKERMYRRYRQTWFTTIVWEEKWDNNSIRYLNQTELERCQTIPEWYTRCLTRNQAADVLWDGWTVDVIAHIFSFIPKQNG
jgi:DNA (cytosine-5)-methyltransferase 3A